MLVMSGTWFATAVCVSAVEGFVLLIIQLRYLICFGPSWMIIYIGLKHFELSGSPTSVHCRLRIIANTCVLNVLFVPLNRRDEKDRAA